MAGQAQFMTELYKAVKTGMEEGKSVEDLQASVKLPETVSTWVSEGTLKSQIKDTYTEIRK
jgi:hypothetical protein